MRAGIIGAGLMGRVHTAAAKRAGATVVAVSDSDSERAKSLAASIGAPCETVEIARMTESGFVDVVHICTPPGQHAAPAEAALRSRINVICEKPIAQTSAEVEMLFALAKESNVQLCPVHQFPFQRGIQKIIDQASSLGTIRHLNAEICTAGGAGMSDLDRHQVALDILPHPLSLFALFTSGPLSEVDWKVSAVTYGELLVTGVNRNVGLSFLLSTLGRPTSNSLRVIGDAGTATANLFHGFSVIERGTVSRLTKLTRPFTTSASTLGNAAANGVRRGLSAETGFPGLRELVRRFYESIRGEGMPPISSDTTIDVSIARDRIISSIHPGS